MKSKDTISIAWPPGARLGAKLMDDNYVQISHEYDGRGSALVLDPSQVMWLINHLKGLYEHTKGKDNFSA